MQEITNKAVEVINSWGSWGMPVVIVCASLFALGVIFAILRAIFGR